MDRHLRFPALLLLALAPAAIASSPTHARITQVANDVQLLDSAGAKRPASMDQSVGEGIVVRTGKDSRVEIALGSTHSERLRAGSVSRPTAATEEMIVRLASDTVFSFRNGGRDLNVSEGAVFVQASKKAKGAKLEAGGIAAAITGTTAMFEYHPGVCKFLVLEGTARLYRPGHLGDSILVKPGRMVIGSPTAPLADPVDFDIARFVRTSRFVGDFSPLRSEKEIAQESERQQRAKSKKNLIDTNLVIFGGGTLVSLVDPAQLNAGAAKTDATPAATPTPTPEGGNSAQ